MKVSLSTPTGMQREDRYENLVILHHPTWHRSKTASDIGVVTYS